MDGLILAIAAGAAISDKRKGKVYNALTYPAAACGVLLHSTLSSGQGPGFAFLGLLVGFVPLFLVYLAGGTNGGDVKLMAAVGTFLGPALTLYALLYTCLAGAVLSLGIIMRHEGSKGLFRRLRRLFKNARDDDPLRCPFAVAVFLGTAWLLVEIHLGAPLWSLLTGGAS